MGRVKLIAIEGLDQSGKETQARQLRARLEQDGSKVRSISFPDYETPIGREIARALAGEREFGADVMQLLYIANRFEYRPRMELWIESGDLVICDRYRASSIAYGEAQGLDPRWLDAVQKHLPVPDITVLLDIAPETAAARKRTGRDRYERDLAMLARVRDSYLRQAKHRSWVVIDADQSKDDVAAAVQEAVVTRCARRSARSRS